MSNERRLARLHAIFACVLSAVFWLTFSFLFIAFYRQWDLPSITESKLADLLFGIAVISIPTSIFFSVDALRRSKNGQDQVARKLSLIALVAGLLALLTAFYTTIESLKTVLI